MGTIWGPKYLPYSYMEPLGNRLVYPTVQLRGPVVQQRGPIYG